MPVRVPDCAGPPLPQGRGARGLPAALLALAVMGFVSILLYLCWANTIPPPEPDLRVLPRPNGYDACLAALGRLRRVPPASPLRRPREAQAERLRQALAPDRAALDDLRRALRLDFMAPAADSRGSRPLLFSLVEEAAGRFAAEACVSRAEGDPAAAMERALDAVELGSEVGRGGALSANILGRDCILLGGNPAELCLDLSAEEARAAGERVERILGKLPSYAATVREERRETLARLRRLLPQGPPVSRAARGGVGILGSPAATLRGLLYTRARAYSAMDRYLKAAVRMAQQPYWERRAVPQPDPEEVWLIPNAFRQRGMRWEATRAGLRLLRLELALQEFHQRHGRWPDRLEQLEGVPPEVGEDPFAPAPMCYRRRGAGYRLYSRGPDGRDDGGLAIRSELQPGIRGDLVAGRQWPAPTAW